MLLASRWCSAKSDLDGVSPGRGKKEFIREEAACLGCVQPSLTPGEAPLRWDGALLVGGFGARGWGWVLENAASVEEGQRPAGLGLVEGLCDGSRATPQLPKRSGVHAHLVGGSPSQRSSSMASLQDEQAGSKPTQTCMSLLSIDLPFKQLLLTFCV